MGAHNIEFDVPDCEEREIKTIFKKKQDENKEYNGSQGGYSGDFQTVDSVEIHDKIFDSYKDAHDYCLDHAQKWDFVVAVKYKDKSNIRWLIAGWGAC